MRAENTQGGIGGLVCSVRDGSSSYNYYNGRGDVVAKTDGKGTRVDLLVSHSH